MQDHATFWNLIFTEQKKCWELLAQKIDLFQTAGNNSQQYVACVAGA